MAEQELDLRDPVNLGKIPRHRQLPQSIADRSEGPLIDFDPDAVINFSQFLTSGRETANQFRSLGEAKVIWEQMLTERDNVIYFALSGDMVSAGMSPLISRMIEKRMIDVVFSQGANLFHDLVRTIGYERVKTHSQQFEDTQLFKLGAARMYDVLEPSEAQVFSVVFHAHVAKRMVEDGYSKATTRQLYHYIGKMLVEYDLVEKEGILTTCYRNNVPIYVAGAESSVTAMDLACARNLHSIDFTLDVIGDLIEHAKLQDSIEEHGKRSSLIETGGGVVRNTVQQVATGSYIVRGEPWSMEGPPWFKRHKHAILITTDTGVSFGGASAVPLVEHNPASPYPQGENLSWGKFDPEGKRVTVHMDATVALPLLFLGLRDDPQVQEVLKNRLSIQLFNLHDKELAITYH